MIKDANLSIVEILLKILLPLLITLIITYIIGYERQKIGKAAGISSHTLVAFASASIAILQRLLFESEVAMALEGISVDPQSQRIIAQVLTGIGFIGAGVIIKEHGSIKGITTATTIWSSAIIGIILGSGYIILGSMVGVFIVLFIIFRDFSRGFNPFKKGEKAEDHL
jgi:putative Mg2+ transporter-C (MgtC) family protein